MKKIIIALFLSNLLALNTNMDLVIYERFISEETYENLGSTSIWKYNSDYKNAIETSWERTEPIESVYLER